MFYNTFRSTSREAMKRSNGNLASTGSRSLDPRTKLINMQKREKLKGLLITKFMKKYGIKNPETLLEQEISKFLQGEKLTDADLKKLDKKLQAQLKEKEQSETLRKNLTEENQEKDTRVENDNNRSSDVRLPNLNRAETMSVKSRQSRMSGGSRLSKFNENKVGKQQDADELDDLDLLSVSSRRKPVPRFDFSNEGDEWNAICLYNRQKWEEDKKLNKLKDMHLKQRTKDDLDNQIRQKLDRVREEENKNKEYDQITLDHCRYLEELERQKQLEMKHKVQREKENRDKQLKDEKMRKKKELLKEKKYEKELVSHIVSELDKEKQTAIKKKLEEKEALQKTLKDNELNKIKQQETLQKEREDDVRAADEYSKMLEKQENERIEYFKRIERNANSFMSKLGGTVLKDIEKRNKDEEESMRQFMIEKEKRDAEEDERKKLQEKENKKLMKSYLDMQIDEKKKMNEFEKTLNWEQARIWKIDTNKFHEQEKEINEKVRHMNVNNAEYLKNQISMKKNKNKKMTDEEYALNRNVLENFKEGDQTSV